jgi:ATP phosphoribosyltransferase regulatory subunit
MNHEALVAAARAVFAPDAAWIDPDYVMPADIPLELSGEAVRARLCVFTDARGAENALRPDLTLPVAAREAARRQNGATGAQRYAYAARAFRLPAAPDDPTEFTQVGFEVFGEVRAPHVDAAAFARVCAAIAACGVEPTRIVMGDLAIFPAFVDALALPVIIAGQLKRAFREAGGVRALLTGEPDNVSDATREILAAPDPHLALHEILGARGVPVIGARSAAEILDGLAAKVAAHDAGGVPPEAAGVLTALGAVRGPAMAAADQLDQLCTVHGLSAPRAVIGAFAARTEAIFAAAPRLAACSTFGAGFGRRFTYYDGFLFEAFAGHLSARQPIAAGGRYDGLIAALSHGAASASGIGGVVRPDRLLRVLSGQGA